MRRAFVLVALVMGCMAITPIAQAADNCPFPGANGSYHKATYRVNHRSVEGLVIWSIWLRGESCVNSNGKITAFRWNKGLTNNTSLQNAWEWRGWVDTVNGGGVGFNHVFRRVKGHFELCYIRVGCTVDAYPWVQITMTNSSPWSDGFVSEGL